MNHVSAHRETPYGIIRVTWEKDKTGKIDMDVSVPVGLDVKVFLPNDEKYELAGEDKKFTFYL